MVRPEELNKNDPLLWSAGNGAEVWELFCACAAGNLDPNLAGWLGVTALTRFAREGDIEGAAVSLDHGANLHARDEEFRTTPPGYATAAGQRRMVEVLLGRRGAWVTLPDHPAWATPIALATYRSHGASCAC